MRLSRQGIFSFAAILSGVSMIAVAGGLANDTLQAVDELSPRVADVARNAPIDYGFGPGRGRPGIAGATARRPAFDRRYTVSSSSPGPSASVTGVSIIGGGAYATPPSCAIGSPNIAGGQQAACSVYAFGVNTFALNNSTPGVSYRVNDLLTMNPMAGLTCLNYPIIRVSSVSGNGAITGVIGASSGVCSTFPTTGTYTFSGGSGSGYTTPAGLNGLLWAVSFVAVSGGSGYTSPPNVIFQHSPVATARGTATLTNTNFVVPAAPVGSGSASVQGVFGIAFPWPINALHMALLPDGRILNYGTDERGLQTGALLYDIWDPTLGTGTDAHLTLPNTTSTDLFCSGTSVTWTNGHVLMTGGDLTVNRARNYANNKTTIFDPATNSVSGGAQMQYPRWYGTLVPLPNGDKLVLGGYLTLQPVANGAVQRASTPEYYSPTTGWRSLTGAVAIGADWYYPRAFVTPAGGVFELDANGMMFTRTTSGTGTILRSNVTAPLGSNVMPTVMFAPGKLLSLRMSSTVVIDLNGPAPIVTPTANIDQVRQDASGTLLADGTVLVNGGSMVHNVLTGVAYTSQIWNPATGVWTTGAAASKPRLYHSNAILLPDGSVLTAGGGSPGPIINLNGEIYYPPYFYAPDGSGNPAPRPIIASTQAQGGVPVGGNLGLTMGDMNPVSRVTLVRSGAATHATNVEQRFLDLTSTLVQNGNQITVTLPSNANVALPGYWLAFVFNQAGTPSIGRQILVTN